MDADDLEATNLQVLDLTLDLAESELRNRRLVARCESLVLELAEARHWLAKYLDTTEYAGG